jgi:hypothetical protein
MKKSSIRMIRKYYKNENPSKYSTAARHCRVYEKTGKLIPADIIIEVDRHVPEFKPCYLDDRFAPTTEQKELYEAMMKATSLSELQMSVQRYLMNCVPTLLTD